MEHYTVIVAGKNPEKLMATYDSNNKVERYVVYEYAKAAEYQRKKIEAYKTLLDADISEADKQFVRDCIEEWEGMTPEDFFLDISAGYDFDEETGDAVSTDNPDGKFISYKKVPRYAEPFILKDGKTDYTARKKDIDWSRMHLANTEPHEIAWDTVIEHKKPKTDEERTIYENMKDKVWYFNLFKDKDEFIKSVTSFWGTAFLSEETGWVELESHIPQFKWVREYYDRFIAPLPEGTVLTMYECVRS